MTPNDPSTADTVRVVAGIYTTLAMDRAIADAEQHVVELKILRDDLLRDINGGMPHLTKAAGA